MIRCVSGIEIVNAKFFVAHYPIFRAKFVPLLEEVSIVITPKLAKLLAVNRKMIKY